MIKVERSDLPLSHYRYGMLIGTSVRNPIRIIIYPDDLSSENTNTIKFINGLLDVSAKYSIGLPLSRYDQKLDKLNSRSYLSFMKTINRAKERINAQNTTIGR